MKLRKLVGATVLGCVVVAGGAGIMGARFNTTKSIPVGLYWVEHQSASPGRYVMFCPPHNETFHTARTRRYIDAGACPGNYGFMMKRVFAQGGDHIEVTADGVTVNGIAVPHSRPLQNDADGNPLPRFRGTFVLAPSEVLLMSGTSGTSFDARYFGPVSRAQIKSVIRPVITW